MADQRTLPRRRHSKELKAQVLAECAQAGASVAGVALAHGLNANVVHKWRREAAARIDAVPVTGFIPLALPAAASAVAQADKRAAAVMSLVTRPS